MEHNDAAGELSKQMDAVASMKSAVAAARPASLRKAEARLRELRDRRAAVDLELSAVCEEARRLGRHTATADMIRLQSVVARADDDVRIALAELERERMAFRAVFRRIVTEHLQGPAGQLLSAADAIDGASVSIATARRLATENGQDDPSLRFVSVNSRGLRELAERLQGGRGR